MVDRFRRQSCEIAETDDRARAFQDVAMLCCLIIEAWHGMLYQNLSALLGPAQGG